MEQMSSCFFEEKNEEKIHHELLKFIYGVRSDLDIVFPVIISYSLIDSEIINAIVNKKLNDGINTKLLYLYNDNTKVILKKISPFIFSKRLEFPINNSYIFIRDNNDVLLIDIDKLSFNDTSKIDKHFFDATLEKDKEKYNNIQNNYDRKSDTVYMIYSKNKSLASYMKSFFQAVWSQKEIYDNMIEEKSHSDLLVDLITHDIGNHHGIVQGGLDIMSELINEKLKQLDYISNSSSMQNYDTSDSDEDKFKVNKNNGNNSMILPSADSKSFDLDDHEQEQEIKTVLTKDFLQELLSYVSMVQGALDKSQSLVKNIIKLEKMYRQKEVHLYKKNIVDSIEEAKEVFNNRDGYYPNKGNDKEIKLEVFIDKNFKQEDINIMADDLLKEIFINIFSNSIKYTNKYPLVPIHISITEYDISDTKYWMILVSDYGKGIPDSIKDGLFERFYSKASGSGLGLSIVRSLIERYNGRVWASDRVASSHREGVTIGMIFPKY